MNLFELFGVISIEASGAHQTIDDTMTKVDGLRSSLEGAEKQSGTTGKSFGVGSTLHSGAVALGNIYTKVATGIANVGRAVVKTGFGFDASMEAYQNQFEALLNDADKAKQLVSDLQNLAKISPLGMEGLANNAVSLLNSGTALAEVVPTLEMLGNLSLGDTNKMNSIVRAYTQILSKGQLMAQEMYQLGDAGVPVREIMTLYGGDEFADGSWYEAKMTDPSYKIMAEDMVAAFQLATAEGGKWHDYMFKMMDTWNGQTDRLGEEGKETLGSFFKPFFDVAKEDVLPRITESLGRFGTWVSENQDVLSKMADAIGGLVTGGLDKLIGAFEWMMENGEVVKAGLIAISTGLLLSAVAAHPLAAAIMAVVGGLTYLWSAIETPPSNAFSAYTQEEIELLNQYHEAVKAAQQAREDYANADGFDKAALWDAQALADANVSDILSKIMMRSNGNEMMRTYNDWFSSEENAMQLSIPVSVSEESESEIQSTVAGYDLKGDASIYADPKSNGLLQSYLDGLNLSAVVKLVGDASGLLGDVPGFATGLNRVPYDNMLAYLHKDEAVLTAAEAAVWRGEKRESARESAGTSTSSRAADIPPVVQYITVAKNEDFETGVRNALEMLRWQG